MVSYIKIFKMKVMVQTTSIHLSAHDLNRLVCDLYFWA